MTDKLKDDASKVAFVLAALAVFCARRYRTS